MPVRRPTPTALQQLAPLIIEDGGRRRARTLLALVAAGPDYVAARLPDLHAFMGEASPGMDELTGLIDAVRTATSPVAPTVSDRHVISRVLLRRWTEQGKPGAGRQLMRYDVIRGATKLRSVAQLGYVLDFVKIDSLAVEKVWQRVENHLREAITAAEDGSLKERSSSQRILREAIALHFVRSPIAAAVHEYTWKAVSENRIRALADTPLAVEAFRQSHGGLVPAGSEGRRMGAEAVLARLAEAHESGAIFRLLIEERFDRVCQLLDQAPLEVIVPAQRDDEFILGDVPALTFDGKTGAAGVADGVPLTAGDTVMLPLGPRLLVALGPRHQTATVSHEFVERINQLQLRAATEYVVHRPGARVGSQLAGWRLPAGPGAN